MKTIPYAKFSTEMIEPSQRRDAWIESARTFNDVAPIDKKNPEFNGGVEIWDVDGILFGTSAFDPAIMDHRKNVHNRSGQHDFILVGSYRQGAPKTIHDGIPSEIRPHDVHVLDYRCDRRLVVSEHTWLDGVILPYEAIGFEPGQHPAGTTFSHTESSGYVLSKLISMIRERMATATLDEGREMSAMFSGALRSLIAGDNDSAARQQTISCRRAVMQRFIAENIHDLNLNVETLCRKFGVSRATVFRDFQPVGLQHFLTLHRLDRALTDIASGPAIRGRIALIAHQWGFSSPAHFSRVFRERFGFSPSDAIGVGREAGLISAREDEFDRDWMPFNINTGLKCLDIEA